MVDGIKQKFGLKLQYDILCEVIGFTLPKYPFQRWKVWVEINDKWRKGEIVAEGKQE